jgi:hypothetical protein
MNQPNEKQYWFLAKRYGWGWGLPCAWQGWVVLAVYLALIIGGILIFGGHPQITIPYMVILSAALIAICWLKGEPPRWRWGKD